MGNKFTITFIVLLLVAGVAFTLLHADDSSVDTEGRVIVMTPDGIHYFRVAIADNDQERSTGLMFVEKMDNDAGMLFVFEEENIRTFWMKNTKITLDMIFINSNGEIVSIQKNAQPCTSDQCKMYSSVSPATYVLEINGGLANKKNINVGDTVHIDS